jgi:hypothetical protein
MSFRSRCAFFFIAAAIICLVATTKPAAAADYDYATTNGYSALATGDSASVSLQDNTVTIDAGPRGGGITLGITQSYTFAGEDPLTNLSNPAWVAGTRGFFDVAYTSTDAAGDSTVTLDINFSQPLPAFSYLVFVDFDAREVLNIRAYDTSSVPLLLDYSAFSFSRQNGNTQDGALLTHPVWNTLAGYTGSLATDTFDSNTQPVVSLLTSVAISRLEYEFEMSPDGSVGSNSVQFNFAAVPEPSTYALLVLAAAALAAHTRRRR